MLDDEARLESYLDEHPGDLAARLVLADLLDDLGHLYLSQLQRWLVSQARWPDNDLEFCGLTGWHWWSSVSSAYRDRIHAVVPAAAQDHMPGGQWLFASRLEAEAILASALEQAGLLGSQPAPSSENPSPGDESERAASLEAKAALNRAQAAAKRIKEQQENRV